MTTLSELGFCLQQRRFVSEAKQRCTFSAVAMLASVAVPLRFEYPRNTEKKPTMMLSYCKGPRNTLFWDSKFALFEL